MMPGKTTPIGANLTSPDMLDALLAAGDRSRVVRP